METRQPVEIHVLHSNVLVAERALQIYNHYSKYAITTAACPTRKMPRIQSFYNVMQPIQDLLTPVKNFTYVYVLHICFFQKFQTDKPMSPSWEKSCVAC